MKLHMKNREITISDRKIGEGCSTFFIAEISANHAQDINKAIELIKMAKNAGADAVKFQTYTPDTMTLDSDKDWFMIDHPKWGGQTLYELYEKACTPWEWFGQLKKEADEAGLIFLSTIFDKTSVDFLEELEVQAHKIASFELVDLPLIEYAAKTGKPLILSTGMATKEEIKDAVGAAKQAGAKDIVLLKCVSGYPANPGEMNLRTIPDMEKQFDVPIGLSDHTLDSSASLSAASMGVCVIEKHFTDSRERETPDSFFSTEPREFKKLMDDIRTGNIQVSEKVLGRVHYGLTPQQKKSRVFRRSLFVVRDIQKGEVFTEENIRSLRPNSGLKPKHLKNVIGKRSERKIAQGSPLRMDMIEI